MKKSLVIAVLFALAAFLLAGPVCADRGDHGGGRFGGWSGPGQSFEERQAMRMERRERMREMRREDIGRQEGRDGGPPFGRMTPEERRQLRHDVRSAGEGFYRRPPPGYQP